jgi:uncharacterized protein YutE (UPF0331/DUF86 family)
MSLEATESILLESVVPDLEADGYEVFPRPRAPLLPAFMRGYRPDAIAYRKDRKLAIEVLRPGVPSKLGDLLSERKDWELRVYWVSSSGAAAPIEPASRASIERTITTVEDLVGDGRTQPALLMAWAAFEAIGRLLLPDRFERPQTPSRLIEALASEGFIMPSEAAHVRRLAESRNRVVHGGLDTAVPEADLRGFVEILQTLSGFIP